MIWPGDWTWLYRRQFGARQLKSSMEIGKEETIELKKNSIVTKIRYRRIGQLYRRKKIGHNCVLVSQKNWWRLSRTKRSRNTWKIFPLLVQRSFIVEGYESSSTGALISIFKNIDRMRALLGTVRDRDVCWTLNQAFSADWDGEADDGEIYDFLDSPIPLYLSIRLFTRAEVK